jgi:acetyl esterase/lipase
MVLMAAIAVTAVPAQTGSDRPAAGAVTQAMPYVERPRISSLKVSPSNKHAAFLWRGNEGRLVLTVVDVAEPSNVRVVAGNPQLDISNIHWVNDRRLVFDARPPELMIFEGEAGTFGVDIDGQRLQLLVSWTLQVGAQTGTRIQSRVLPYGWAFFRAVAGRGDEALFYQVENAEQGRWGIVAVARLDTATGQLRRVSDGKPEDTVWHVTNPDGNLRIVVTESGGRARVHHRPGGSREWEVVEDLPLFDGSRMAPLYIEADGSWVVSSRLGRDADALFVHDPKARKLDPEPLVAVEGFDMGAQLEVDTSKRTLVGVHIETSQPQTVWLDARLAQLQRAIDAALPPGRMNRLLCGDCSTAQRFVVHSKSDRQPGEYFVFDTVAKRLVRIAASRPGLPEVSQGVRSFHRVAARDGLSLPVVVTHPPGVEAKSPRPLVLLVHGGPHVRGGSRAWDGFAQFVAAQGHRVLEVEFRGSTGFGARHLRAGFKHWGQAMQDDLADAVAWAVREGLGEPGRACIVGGSYGGYAALMGPVRHPELYRCAASINGVTDTTRLFSRFRTDISEQARRYQLTETLGEPVADKAMLERFSPLNRVADIHVPLMVTRGERDTLGMLAQLLLEGGHSDACLAGPESGRRGSVTPRSRRLLTVTHRLWRVPNEAFLALPTGDDRGAGRCGHAQLGADLRGRHDLPGSGLGRRGAHGLGPARQLRRDLRLGVGSVGGCGELDAHQRHLHRHLPDHARPRLQRRRHHRLCATAERDRGELHARRAGGQRPGTEPDRTHAHRYDAPLRDAARRRHAALQRP